MPSISSSVYQIAIERFLKQNSVKKRVTWTISRDTSDVGVILLRIMERFLRVKWKLTLRAPFFLNTVNRPNSGNRSRIRMTIVYINWKSRVRFMHVTDFGSQKMLFCLYVVCTCYCSAVKRLRRIDRRCHLQHSISREHSKSLRLRTVSHEKWISRFLRDWKIPWRLFGITPGPKKWLDTKSDVAPGFGPELWKDAFLRNLSNPLLSSNACLSSFPIFDQIFGSRNLLIFFHKSKFYFSYLYSPNLFYRYTTNFRFGI